MPVRIQRQRRKGWRMPPNTVYVGRPTPYGNPWTVGKGWDAASVVAFYLAWLSGCYDSTTLPPRPDLSTLRGKDLACWCRTDQPCHADVLLLLANQEEAKMDKVTKPMNKPKAAPPVSKRPPVTK